MSLSIPDELARSLGWRNEERIIVLIGTDEDHGILRLTAHPDGQAKLIERQANKGQARYFMLPLGAQSDFVNRREFSQKCNYEILDGNTLEMTLPAWADETHPHKRRAVPPQPPAPPAKPAPVKLDQPIMQKRGPGRPPGSGKAVTTDIMGDPPRDRQSIMQRLGKL